MNYTNKKTPNRDSVTKAYYRIVSILKTLSGNFNYCRGPQCAGARSKFNFEIVSYKHIPFSRKCKICGFIESPTSGTGLHGINDLPAFFNLAKIIVDQKVISRRLSNSEILKILKGEECEYYDCKLNQMEYLGDFYDKMLLDVEIENYIKKNVEAYQKQLLKNKNELYFDETITLQTVKNYRNLLQPFIKDWSNLVAPSKNIYGVCKFLIQYRGIKKVIMVARQLCPNGHIRARVYPEDTYSSLLHFLQNNVGLTTNIIIFDWGKEYDSIKKKLPTIEFRTGDMPYKQMVLDIKDGLNRWLQGLVLSNDFAVQQVINEYIFLTCYDYITYSQLVKFIIENDKPRKREKTSAIKSK